MLGLCVEFREERRKDFLCGGEQQVQKAWGHMQTNTGEPVPKERKAQCGLSLSTLLRLPRGAGTPHGTTKTWDPGLMA